MGIPIDEDDPVNGGCPICIDFMPDFLWVVFQSHLGDSYTGIVETFEFGRWDGLLFSPTGPDRQCIVDVCADVDGKFRIWVAGTDTIFAEHVHCNLPISGTNIDGASVTVSKVP